MINITRYEIYTHFVSKIKNRFANMRVSVHGRLKLFGEQGVLRGPRGCNEYMCAPVVFRVQSNSVEKEKLHFIVIHG